MDYERSRNFAFYSYFKLRVCHIWKPNLISQHGLVKICFYFTHIYYYMLLHVTFDTKWYCLQLLRISDIDHLYRHYLPTLFSYFGSSYSVKIIHKYCVIVAGLGHVTLLCMTSIPFLKLKQETRSMWLQPQESHWSSLGASIYCQCIYFLCRPISSTIYIHSIQYFTIFYRFK